MVIETWKSRFDTVKDLVVGEEKLQKILDRVELTVAEKAENEKRLKKMQNLKQPLSTVVKSKIKDRKLSGAPPESSSSSSSSSGEQLMYTLEEEKFPSVTTSKVTTR